MSADDPTDAELERDANAHLGASKHRPRLGTESRAINPRELLDSGLGIMEAEMLRQQEHLEEDGDTEGEYEYQAPPPPPRRPVAQRPPMQRPDRRPNNVSPFRRPTPPPRGLEAGSQAAPFHVAEAWDRYVIAALQLAVHARVPDAEAEAIAVADRLLEERRRRFG